MNESDQHQEPSLPAADHTPLAHHIIWAALAAALVLVPAVLILTGQFHPIPHP